MSTGHDKTFVRGLIILVALAVVVVVSLGVYLFQSAPESEAPPPVTRPAVVKAAATNTAAVAAQPAAPLPAVRPAAAAVPATAAAATPPARPAIQGGSPEADLAAWIKSIREKGTRDDVNRLLQERGRELGLKDFKGAVELALKFDDREVLNALLMGVFEGGAETDAREALAVAGKLKDTYFEAHRGGRTGFYGEMIYRSALIGAVKGWATMNAEAALQYAGELPEQYRQTAVSAAYTSWARKNPAAAFDSVKQLPAELQRHTLQGMYYTWAEAEPGAAGKHAMSFLETGSYREAVLGSIMGRWVTQDFDATVAWANQNLRDEGALGPVLRETVDRLTFRDPAKAARLIDLYPDEKLTSTESIGRIINAWSTSEPQAAAAWVGKLADEAQRAAAIKQLAGNWGVRAPEQAEQWARSLPDEPQQAYALSNIALRRAQEVDDARADWIDGLQKGFVHDRTLAGYALGKARRAGDLNAARRIQEAIGETTVDLPVIRSLVLESRLNEADKEEISRRIQ